MKRTRPENERDVWRLPTFLGFAFAAMILWPMIGIAFSFSMFDKTSEAVLLFGGLSGLLLLPIYVIFPLSETVFGMAIVVIWLLIWILASVWLTSGTPSRRTQIIGLATLSGISLMQAALGFLMIIGKSV